MQNNEKKKQKKNKNEGAESEERKRNKKTIFNSKKESDKGSFIYEVHKKSRNFGPPSPSLPRSTSIQF